MSEDPTPYEPLDAPVQDHSYERGYDVGWAESRKQMTARIEALRAAVQVVGNMPTDYIEQLDYEKATVAAADRFLAWLEQK